MEFEQVEARMDLSEGSSCGDDKLERKKHARGSLDMGCTRLSEACRAL